jgi:hypothetical protein
MRFSHELEASRHLRDFAIALLNGLGAVETQEDFHLTASSFSNLYSPRTLTFPGAIAREAGENLEGANSREARLGWPADRKNRDAQDMPLGFNLNLLDLFY